MLTTSFVEASLPVTAASVLQALQTSTTVGILFEFAMLAALGGILAVVALLIGRVVPVWLPILLLVGLLLSAAGGGVVGAALTLPFLAAAVLLARALIRPQDAAQLEAAPAQQPVTA
jgi:fucose 4-O-acetylase-like acetyltransferase